MREVRRFQTYEEFWPFYVREHSNKLNRTLHVVGTSCALGLIGAAAITRRPLLLLAAPVVGYGMAWFGHFVVQKNRPATFDYPLWSLRGDFDMLAKTLAGTMDAEVERVMRGEADGQAHEPPPVPGDPAVN